MANFFAELKRRHIYRVAAAYAVVAWVLLQIVNNVAPVLDLPPWVARAFLLALIIAFPIAMLFAWMRELAPADGAAAPAKASKLDWALIGALIVVIGLVSYQQIAASPGAPVGPRGNIPSGAISIAVLPFVNLSDDRAQEFFSDGITEEITAALAKIPNLRVVARTSAFQFKGQNQDMRSVGQALGANHLIEGSVRKAGDRVRITAQLIKVDDGTHLWTESYDRQLTDIFAIQEDIAQTIAGALKVPLGLEQGESLVPNRTQDLDLYQQYLLAKTLVRTRAIEQAIAILEPLVARDPNYSPASALLAYTYWLLPSYSSTTRSGAIVDGRRVQQSSLENGSKAARRAMVANPKNALAYGALGGLEGNFQHRWADAEELLSHALTLDPNDPDIVHLYSLFLAAAGRLQESLAYREKLRTLEPFVPIYNLTTALIMQINGQNGAAISMLEATPSDAAGGFFRNAYLAQAYAATGRLTESANTLLLITGDQVSRQSVQDAATLLRQAPAAARAPETLPRLDSELSFVYAHVGAVERMMEYPERTTEIGYGFFNSVRSLWVPEAAPLRKTTRFKALMRTVGLVDYWRAKGWPDRCHPTTADDFECN